MLQPAISTEHDIRANYTVWTDACAGTDFCTGINDGRRVNPQFTHFQPLTSILSPLCKGRGGIALSTRFAYRAQSGTPRPLQERGGGGGLAPLICPGT